MEYLFWILLTIVFYTYIVYPAILFFINTITRFFKRNAKSEKLTLPPITFFVAAYNEENFIKDKIKNTLKLDYPKEKIQYLWVTDGSTDNTPDILNEHEDFLVLHKTERNGKTGAINRGMKFAKNEIVIFSDANTFLNKDALTEIIKPFSNQKVGCVAGEKRIIPKEKDNAVNSGEGIYWKYESFLKQNESDFFTTIGAVGELFAIRTELFSELQKDTILDDFIISLNIAIKGFKINYSPNSYAYERASANINEELKRKNRIAFGGFQSIPRLKALFNPFKNPILFFQFISHKFLRWTLVPLAFFLLPLINLYLTLSPFNNGFYKLSLAVFSLLYIIILIGYLLQNKNISSKFIFAPYYVFIMNLSQIIGFLRFIRKKQNVNWEKAKRG